MKRFVCLFVFLFASIAIHAQVGPILRVTSEAPADEDADVVSDDLTGAGPFTVNYATSDGLAHQLIFTTTTNESGITATLVGTDADGRAQTEAFGALPNNTTKESAKYFLTLTSITLSATVGADTFDVGIVDEVTSASIPLNWPSAVGAKFFLDISGTLNVDVQFTVADPALFADQSLNLWVEPYSTLVAETADSSAVVAADPGYGWYRIQWNSYSSGATAKLYASQPGP
jgi:hypothetical protein